MHLFLGKELVCRDWIIKPLIWALYGQRRGRGQTARSTPPRLQLPFYITIDLYTETQSTASIFTPTRAEKHICTTWALHSRRKTDWPTEHAHVKIKYCTDTKTKDEFRQTDTQIGVEGHFNLLVWLPACLSVCLSLYLNIDTLVWSAPGFHCQSCNNVSEENWCMRQLIFRNTPLLVHK